MAKESQNDRTFPPTSHDARTLLRYVFECQLRYMYIQPAFHTWPQRNTSFVSCVTSTRRSLLPLFLAPLTPLAHSIPIVPRSLNDTSFSGFSSSINSIIFSPTMIPISRYPASVKCNPSSQSLARLFESIL